MIRYYFLENNKVIPAPEFNLDKIVWCDVLDPTDNELIDISQKFSINIEDLEDCLDQTERPRFNYDSLLKNNFLLLRVISNFEVDVTKKATTPIGIFFTAREKIITVHSTLAQNFNEVIEIINRQTIWNSWFLITAVLHVLVRQLDQISQKIATKIMDLQDMVLKTQLVKDITEPFKLNSYLIFFNTSMYGNNNTIKAFFTKHKAIFDAYIPLLENYDDVMVDIDQIYTYTSIFRDQFTNIVDAFASVINNNLSNVMKVVGSISLILMIPTLIASLYGMNVGLPGGVTGPAHYTFYIILLISVLISIVTWLFFRRVKFKTKFFYTVL
jgi:magnesium transporter